MPTDIRTTCLVVLWFHCSKLFHGFFDFHFYRRFLTNDWFLNHIAFLTFETSKVFRFLSKAIHAERIWIQLSKSRSAWIAPCISRTVVLHHREQTERSTHVESYIRADWILCHLPNVIIYEWCMLAPNCVCQKMVKQRRKLNIGSIALSFYSNSVVCSISDTKPDADGRDPFISSEDGKI